MARHGMTSDETSPVPTRNVPAIVGFVVALVGLIWNPVLLGFVAVILGLYAERGARVEGRPLRALAISAAVLGLIAFLWGMAR